MNADSSSFHHTLRAVFGFESFRPNQKAIIHAILNKRDVFAVMPTGGGKSICYQLPALLMHGTAVIVTLLISLMKDQVDAAKENGIEAVFMNSSLDEEEVSGISRRLKDGRPSSSTSRWNGSPCGSSGKRSGTSTSRSLPSTKRTASPNGDMISGLITSPSRSFPANFPVFRSPRSQQRPRRKCNRTSSARIGLRTPHIVRASFNRPNLVYQVELK